MDQFSTTKASLAARMKKIQWDELPISFQDAITIATEQGIKYLWIDSLCIIQDDESDWKWHAQNMCDVYANSILNIGLTCSMNNAAGCLGERWLDHVGGTCVQTVTIPLQMGDQENMFYARKPLHLAHRTFDYRSTVDTAPQHKDDETKMQDAAPLLYRGWVFQERMLAPRMIHFHRSEMVWECRTSILCECGGMAGSTMSRWIKRVLAMPEVESPSDRARENVRSAWRAVVARYSGLQLTRQSDKLIALAGLARPMQRISKFQYLAGHLFSNETELAWQLLWKTQKFYWGSELNFSYRPSETGVPAWSWVSMHTSGRDAVRMPSLPLDHQRDKAEAGAGSNFIPHSEFNIITLDTFPETEEDDTFTTRSCHLLVRGPLLLGVIDMTEPHQDTQSARLQRKAYPANYEPFIGMTGISTTVHDWRISGDFSPDCDDWVVEDERTDRTETAFFLLVGHVLEREKKSSLGLVLRKVPGRRTETHGRFQRIGTVDCSADSLFFEHSQTQTLWLC
jgi:hypothetical protein